MKVYLIEGLRKTDEQDYSTTCLKVCLNREIAYSWKKYFNSGSPYRFHAYNIKEVEVTEEFAIKERT